MDSYTEYDVKYELDGQLFIWNSIKYDLNMSEHKITFIEAATVFIDSNEVNNYERFL